MEIRQERRKWTEAEDAVLRKEVESQSNAPWTLTFDRGQENSQVTGAAGSSMNWAAISEKLPGRTNKDCRKRWSKSVDGGRKGIWTEDEDERLIHAVNMHGTRWTQVAQYVGTRHADQCAKRWQHSLDPNVNRSDWTQEEDDALFLSVSEVGRNWRQIASTTLPGRSTTHLKNRYELICRRRQEQHQSNSRDINIDDDLDSADASSGNEMSRPTEMDHTTHFDSQPDSNFCIQPNPLDIENFQHLQGIHMGQAITDSEHGQLGTSIPDSLDNSLSSANSFPSVFDESLPSHYATSESLWTCHGNDQMMVDPNSYGNSAIADMAGVCESRTTMASTPCSSLDFSESCLGKINGLDITSSNCTLVLEGIEADTVGLICDSLMRKNIRFDMRVHRNTG